MALIFDRYFRERVTLVKVYVGPDRENCWILPEDFLCERLDFFRAAFKSNFKEGREKIMYLEEDSPAAFALLVDWLSVFDEILPCTTCQIGPSHKLDDCPDQLKWSQLYELADKVGAEIVQRGALYVHRKCAEWEDTVKTQTQGAIDFAYQRGHKALQENLVENALRYFFTKTKLTMEDWTVIVGYHPLFHVEVMIAIERHVTSEELRGKRMCDIFLCKVHEPNA